MTTGPGMTPPEPAAARRELEELRGELRRIDDHGTRGVGAVQTQLTEVIKDVAELKTDMIGRFAEHTAQHVNEVRSRRWVIGTTLAALVLLVAILGLLVDVSQRVRR